MRNPVSLESKKKNTCSLPCAGLAFLGGFARTVCVDLQPVMYTDYVQ